MIYGRDGRSSNGMNAQTEEKSWKFVHPYHGLFRMVSVTPTNAEVVLIDWPNDDSILVSLKRVRPCYKELPDI